MRLCFAALALAICLPGGMRAGAQTQRTPDGQPDLQGIWTNGTITPFERPARFAGRAELSEREAADLEAQAAERRAKGTIQSSDLGDEPWLDFGTKVVSTRQTSLVVDPPDGRVPLTTAAEARTAFNIAHYADSWEYMGLWERCITRGVPGGMFPGGHNNAYQIIQTPGFVVIVYEMIHEAHIIPLTGTHLPAHARQLNGDSIGRWEGETLVVDTIGFNGHGQIASSVSAGRLKGVAETTGLHVVQRFTRAGEDTIRYEVTVEDPEIYTRPWTAVVPLTRDEDYRMFEYACHEGNQTVQLTLGAGRAAEKHSGFP